MDAKPKPPLHAKSKPSLHEWLSERKGIAHAHEALRAGYSRYQLRVALAVWDSALNSKRVSEEQLTQLPLRSAAARAVRAASTCFSDSGI
ncbi:MAG: hypothetical protein ABI310_02490, partial [Microbacteriaceae bacterium]